MIGMIHKFLVTIISLGGLVLGFWVLLSDKKSKLHRNYFYSVIILIIWLILSFASYSIGTLNVKAEATSMLLLWDKRISWLLLSLFFIFAYRFIKFLFKEKFGKFDKSYTIVWIVLAYIATTPWMISGASFLEDGSKLVEKGFLIYIWLLCAVGSSLFMFYRLYMNKKFKILIGGIATGVLSIAFIISFLMNNIVDVLSESIGVYSIIFLIISGALVLLKKQLFNSRFIINILLIVIFLALSLVQVILSNNYLMFILYLSLGVLFIIFLFNIKKQGKILDQEVLEGRERINLEQEILDKKVQDLEVNKKNLEKRVKELERWNKLTQGREKLLEELKKKVVGKY